MNKKMLTLILGIALAGCFFLEYWAGMSGLDFVKGEGNDWQKYIWCLIPLSGLLLFIGALTGNYFLGRGILSWLPLLALIYLLIVNPMIHGTKAGDVFKSLGNSYGVGLWITIGVSLILAFYNPRPRA